MAPSMAKSATNAAAVTRLVETVGSLKTEVTELKKEIQCCCDVIRKQERLLTYQNGCIQRILSLITNTNHSTDHFHPALNISQQSLNESGPHGLIFIHDELPQTITPPEPHSPTGLSPSLIASPAPESPVAGNPAPAGPSPVCSTPESPEQTSPERVNPLPLPRTRRARARQAVDGAGQSKPRPPVPGAVPAICGPNNMDCPPVPPAPCVPLTGAPCPPGLRAGAPRVVSLHVFNLSEDTTVEDVVRHVQKQLHIQSPVCEQLVVTRGNYSSFRLDVPAEKQRIARDAKNWPEGVSVRLFNVVQPKNLAAKRITLNPK